MVYISEMTSGADDIYAPIMSRRQQTERIRATLAILERHRFLFSLPNTLHDNAKLVICASIIRRKNMMSLRCSIRRAAI